MIRVLFVCHGNICRSPMAEFVFKDMVKKKGLEDKFYIASAATSTEEIGNPVHPGTVRKLKEVGIFVHGKTAFQIKKSDYDSYDYIIVMEEYNIRNLKRIIKSDPENKINKLLDFTSTPGDIDDPWYTGNFDITYEEIYKGCEGLLEHILKEHKEL
ncbi:low molecular weight protein-tyrosine-phosphatase [Alloiococcus sp. CFN-8]|uniref:low molecular weight protein-tyrosine-phosphatase n=1 Tax=Alloiococcus sp. CFN-8 TaxID=3416081 RepID=UPI003CF543A0